MINHDVTDRIATERIITIRCLSLAAAKAHVTNNDVMGVELHRVAGDANTVARCAAAVAAGHVSIDRIDHEERKTGGFLVAVHWRNLKVDSNRLIPTIAKV